MSDPISGGWMQDPASRDELFDQELHRRWHAEKRLIEEEENRKRSLAIRRVVWCVVVVVLLGWVIVAGVALLALL
jgi:hypothetical protein